MTELVDRFLEAHVDGYGVSDFSAAVEALVAAGLISDEAGTRWKAENARIRGLGAAHRGLYDPSVEAKAIELLEALFEPVRPSDSPNWDGAIFQRYQEALSTLTASAPSRTNEPGRGLSARATPSSLAAGSRRRPSRRCHSRPRS